MPEERNRRLTAKTVASALRQCRGNVSAVARMFGVSRQATHKYINARPGLQAVAQECRETMLDMAETIVENAILAGDVNASQWYLTRLGKHRGYVERHEHSGQVVVQTVQGVDEGRLLGGTVP